MDGIIPLYKERGLTSFDCVAKLRHILHTKKIGHSGTLDPSVDGVLPICVGSATKVVPYLMASGKVYKGTVTLGLATTTEDLDGDVITRQPLATPFTREQLVAAAANLTGTIQQTPPMYSAVKVNGRKLYEYARAGETVTRPTRTITVTAFDLVEAGHFDKEQGTQTIAFEIACSKGTYVRTLAVDLGRQLGVPAVMASLTRLKSGGFELDQAVTLAQVEAAMAADDLSAILRPIDYALQDYPHVALSDRFWGLVKNGVFLDEDQVGSTAPTVALTYQGQTKCLYQYLPEKKQYKPLKMFAVN
ncbi:tRNA pseudouridine(55) synthase TruB [Levilactobacillus tujiorum]|uniref:tRNA pseudouridine synthase B n=1 Tax=Levilactobacillus tujiorum TaxID=2912243 RepID=A0ABX1L804_9LACO|nr:tRNA pseudouridine(55) synthase TruB [Levilactobacillus tujiorum]MCH5464259.1 tRNA pseudouridine(55) synthase TruB [Levilactobacillus tujiorum]NLR11306.1 tRNA pseudouridine(55) synthase TruB [Lactobacillus sp. HBUAS51387]NLR29240.1 tRNA pseudouridine(55) synthase TruB [Levilactobacillus tujiorum]